MRKRRAMERRVKGNVKCFHLDIDMEAIVKSFITSLRFVLYIIYVGTRFQDCIWNTVARYILYMAT